MNLMKYFITPENEYDKLAQKIFAISLDMTNDAGDFVSKLLSLPRYSAQVIQTATNAGTCLFEYATLLMRNKIKEDTTSRYEFEREDNRMIEAFAKKLMVPAVGLHKIITEHSDIKEWNRLLAEMPLLQIKKTYYINKIQIIIEDF